MSSTPENDGRPEPRQDAPAAAPRSRARSILREVVFLTVLVMVVLSARASLADHYYVPSGSMRPTVEEGDHLVVNKLAYGLRIPRTNVYVVPRSGPRRGEVVVLSSPQDGTVLLKRVVAIPGDEIRVDSSGRLHLNGQPVEVLQEDDSWYERLGESPHTVRLTSRPLEPYGPQKVPEDQYLVLGDNRGESQDGRNFGLVHRNAVLGRAIAIYWRGGLTWLPFH
jgi:signal peptidase I